jgi:membrane protein required for beta-lactamase induction
VFFEIEVALVGTSTLILIRSQIDEQKLEQFGHDSKQFIVKLIVELIIKVFIGSLSQRLDDVVYRLPDEFLDLVVVFLQPVGSINVGHQVNEQMRNLVDEFERFGVLENDVLLFLFLLFLAVLFFVVLAPIDLEFRLLHVLTQSDQKLSLIFEELEQFEVVVLVIERGRVRG